MIVQAGTSDDGMDVAARFAEVIFSANLTIDSLPEVLQGGEDARRRTSSAATRTISR